MPRLKVQATVLSLATLFATAAFGQNAISARPGTLNYIEGQATINGQELSTKSVGKTELGAGQTIETANGKAEVLLTPGVFLRLDGHSAVRMISPDLTHTEVQVDRGRAQVEVDQLYKQNKIIVSAGSSRTQLLKQGLYSFDADSGQLRVFDGKAAVLPDDPDNEKPITVKGGKELALNGDLSKPQKFDRDKSEDSLFQWSSLRSQYLGEANIQTASQYAGASGFNPGWYWNTGLYSYTWLPGGGPYFSPFGYGFYSPSYLYGGGAIYGGYPGGIYGGGYPGGAYRGGIYRNGQAWRGGDSSWHGGQIYRGGAPSSTVQGGAVRPGGAALGGGGYYGGASISNGGMSRGGGGGGMSRGGGGGGGMSRGGGGGGHR